MTTDRPAPPPRPGSASDRRTIVAAAAVLLLTILGGVLAVVLTADDEPARDRTEADGGGFGELPPAEMIPEPGAGREPRDPGDRGGWEQLALLGVMVVAIVGIGAAVYRSSRRGRSSRAAWEAAAATGRDGAVDDPGRGAPDERA